jgi:hypothetical protein
MTTPKNDWEERFDAEFDLDNYGVSHIVQDKVKAFIRAENESSFKEGQEDVLRKVKTLIASNHKSGVHLRSRQTGNSSLHQYREGYNKALGDLEKSLTHGEA